MPTTEPPPALPRLGASAVIIERGAILLVAFDDESGFHYNLPGGGLEPGESLRAALRREVREETGAEIAVGPLLALLEYDPILAGERYGRRHKLTPLFAATLRPDSPAPALPATPDPNQVGVEWLPLAALPAAPLLPPPTPALLALLLAAPARDRFYALHEHE